MFWSKKVKQVIGTEKWQRAFPNLNISDEEKKKLYDRLVEELKEPLHYDNEKYFN